MKSMLYVVDSQVDITNSPLVLGEQSFDVRCRRRVYVVTSSSSLADDLAHSVSATSWRRSSWTNYIHQEAHSGY